MSFKTAGNPEEVHCASGSFYTCCEHEEHTAASRLKYAITKTKLSEGSGICFPFVLNLNEKGFLGAPCVLQSSGTKQRKKDQDASGINYNSTLKMKTRLHGFLRDQEGREGVVLEAQSDFLEVKSRT